MDSYPENKNNKPLRIAEWLFGVFVLGAVAFGFNNFLPNEFANLLKYLSASTSSSVSVTITNAVPEASGASLNDGSAITLTENTTTDVIVAATVTDNNSCKDLTSVAVAVYKDGTTCTSAGNADDNNCYWIVDASPATDASCTGDSDTTYVLPVATFTFPIEFFADPATWKATVYPSDSAGVGTTHTSAGVALNELQSLAVSSSLSYGSVAPGAASTGDHQLDVTNTGNIAIDFNVKGNEANLTCSTRGTIPVGNEEYGLDSFLYGAGTALTAADVSVDADLVKPTSTTPVIDNTFWQITIPNGVAGTCSGAIVFTAIGAI